jgi:FkbM family methyltransferase
MDYRRNVAAGDIAQAQKICAVVLARKPNDGETLDTLGLIAEASGKPNEAENFYRNAIASNPDLTTPRLHLAKILIGKGQGDAARRELVEVERRSLPIMTFVNMGRKRGWRADMNLRPWDLEYAVLSFSFTGEDAFIKKVFKRKLQRKEPGLYVDIGCSWPQQGSNTYLLYAAGWQGVCIDPAPSLMEFFADARPRDRFVNAAVTTSPGQVWFAKSKTDAGMHRIFDTPDAQPGPDYDPLAPVPARRLDAILDETVPPGTAIDLFSIDVEDSEMGVLKSNDWDRYRPKLIVMEAHDFTIATPHSAPTVAFLVERDYQLIGALGPNVFMTDTRAAPT